MASKKRIKRRTSKKVIAEVLALSMCVTIFQPGGGNSVLVYAAEETKSDILKWDFEDNTAEHGWSIPESGQSVLSELKITDGRLGVAYKGSSSEGWQQAGIEVFPDNKIDFEGADKVSLDFYYKDSNKTTGNLSLKIFVQNQEWEDVISGDNTTINITDNENITPEEGQDGFKKVNLTFNLDDKITGTTKIAKISLAVVGQNTDYNGEVYFDNITVSKAGNTGDTGDTNGSTGLKELYDFADGLQGWEKDNWIGENVTVGDIAYDAEGKRLELPVDYTNVSTEDWKDATVCFKDSKGLDFSAYNNMSFDFYYNPSSMTKGNIALKAAASVGNEDLFSEQKSVNDENAEVSDADNGLKKVAFSFKIDEEKAKTLRPEKIDIVITGRETDYNGNIYIGNIRFSKTESVKIKELYDFADGLQGWEKSGWINDGVKPGDVTYDADNQRLKMGIDFSGVADKSWVGAGISLEDSNGIDFSDYNTMSFEFYYEADKLTEGNIALKVSAKNDNGNLFGDQASSINDVTPEDAEGGLKKAVFTFKIDEEMAAKIKPGNIDIIVNGIETGYNGNIYFDNIKFSKVSDDDKYVTSKVPVKTNTSISGTDTALTVNGTEHNYTNSVKLADDKADANTVALYQYLKAVGESSSVIYGHMEDTVLKAGASDLTYSDTEDVTGSISAIDGLDCGGLFSGFADKFISRYPDKAKELGIVKDGTTAENDIKAAAAFSNISIANGAVMTLSAHMPNFAFAEKKENADSINKTYDKFDYSKADSYNLKGDCMNNILPGGKFNEAYTSYLDLIAEYAGLVDGPVLFRPLHENTGGWFWWGNTFCTPDTYKSVFKYTVDYMRDVKGVHNFIYLYGPGSEAASEAEYEERYPGDGYVDMVGFDSYDNNPKEGEGYTFQENFRNTIKLTDAFAKKHNKLFAVTETGIATDGGKALLLTGNGRKDWYNEILDIVTDNEFNCCYFMLWSNYSSQASYYTPFVTKINDDGTLFGHEMLDNFISFYNNEKSIFASDQKAVISGLSNIKKPETGNKELDGYITSPVSGTRILDVTEVLAQFNMETDKKVSFHISGNGKDIELIAEKDSTGKVYTATITKENLDEIGGTLQGKLSLYLQDQLLQEISVIFNIAEKPLDANQIDDFETYGGLTGLLVNKWGTNKDSGCTVDISLVQEPHYEGNYALKFAYSETKNGWGGATISKEADWSQYNALKFFVKPDGKNQKTVIQINAGSGSYEAYLNLYDEYANSKTPLLVTLPFSEFKDKNSSAKTPLSGEALKNISGFGLWVNAIPDSDAFANGETMVSGELYYDDIKAVSSESTIPVFETVSTIPVETPGGTPTQTPTEAPTETPAGKPTETPAGKPTETPAGKPTETPAAPTNTPSGTPAASSVPAQTPGIPLYPPYITTSQPQGGGQEPAGSQAPSGSAAPGTSTAPSGSTAPGTSTAPSGSMAPGTSTAPSGTQAPGTTTETKKDDVTGAVTEITTTVDDNVSKVIEKTTMPDGTQTIKETVSEDINGIITVKETLNSSKSNATLVKNTTKYTDGDIISTDATLYTGNSDIDSDYSARNVIPESFFNEAKEAGISNITLCVEKNIVDDVKNNQGKRMVIKIEVPATEGISVGRVMLSKEAVASAVEGNRRFVVKMVNDNKEDSYTVTIPPSELKKMQGDIDISIKAGKVSEAGGNKQKNIEKVLSANGIKPANAVVVSIASNNTKGGIKASAPVVTQSIKAGDKVYVYCYNNKTGKLCEVPNSKRTVLKNGMTGIEGYPGNDYIVTDKELTGKNVVTLLSQSKVTFNKTSLKKGSKTKLNITLPSELEIKESLKKEASYAKQAAVVTYKTSNTKVVRVSEDGILKAAGKGKAVITVQIKLAGGKVKTVKKKVTVK